MEWEEARESIPDRANSSFKGSKAGKRTRESRTYEWAENGQG